jgi:hypothetical protein
MKYEILKGYKDELFRRITGVEIATFEKMVEILKVVEAIRRAKGGPKPSLSVEEMLLAALEYWREYRTYAHIAASYGVSESQIFRIVKWVEDTLIKDGTFSLPGKKALLQSEMEYEIVLIDATESPIERPKRGEKDEGINKSTTTPERKSTTH